MQPCPVPDIDRALSPYIKSREDTLRVRRALSKYLTASLRPVQPAIQNQHLNHDTPHDLNAVGTNPPGLKGVRSAYLEAIRNQKAAQAKLSSLQSSLEDLQHRHVVETPVDDSLPEDEVIHSYIKLLRQRRRLAELEIIQGSVEKLLQITPIQGLQDPRQLVKDSIGEQPDLPAERLESLSPGDSSDSSILNLKKDVLEARSEMDKAKSARSEVHAIPRDVPSLGAQVYALSCARDEMVAWVQDELAKMEEESGFLEDASPVKRPAVIPSAQDPKSSETQIQDCYAKYTESRSIAIEKHQTLHQLPKTDTPDSQGNQFTQSSSPETKDTLVQTPTSTLSPYLPLLTQINANERHMLLQAVYLQNQIATADEEANSSLSRLAGESHLLPTGSRGVEQWAKTGTELDAQNAKSIQELLQSSRSEINSINSIVDLCSLQSKVLETS